MPNSDLLTPHFAAPFSLSGPGGHAQCVEQDSDEDITQCVTAIVSTPRGFRLELPDFGIEDPLFGEDGPDTNDISRAIEQWEDRASAVVDVTQDVDIDRFAWTVRIRLEGEA